MKAKKYYKELSFKAWCCIDACDDLKKLPSLYQSKKDAVENNTSYFGSDYDDPMVRGVVCECSVKIELPPFPEITDELILHTLREKASPAISVLGDDAFNTIQIKEAHKERERALARLVKLQSLQKREKAK